MFTKEKERESMRSPTKSVATLLNGCIQVGKRKRKNYVSVLYENGKLILQISIRVKDMRMRVYVTEREVEIDR